MRVKMEFKLCKALHFNEHTTHVGELHTYKDKLTRIHSHTNRDIYIYTYLYKRNNVCVCMCVCVCVCVKEFKEMPSHFRVFCEF